MRGFACQCQRRRQPHENTSHVDAGGAGPVGNTVYSYRQNAPANIDGSGHDRVFIFATVLNDIIIIDGAHVTANIVANALGTANGSVLDALFTNSALALALDIVSAAVAPAPRATSPGWA